MSRELLDARGLACPVPVIKLAKLAAAAQTGDVIEILSDDPAAEYDIPAWCRMRGHELLSAAAGRHTIRIR